MVNGALIIGRDTGNDAIAATLRLELTELATPRLEMEAE